METFLSTYKKVAWTKAPERLGIKIDQVSKYTSGEACRDENGEFSVMVRTLVGRPSGVVYKCKFCLKVIGTAGKLLEHWTRSHQKEGHYAHVFRAANGEFKCPVPDCKISSKDRRKLTAHYKDKGAHSATTLLDYGVACWHYRQG